MADEYKYTDVQLAVRHDPDTHYETDANGIRRETELPGFMVVGALVEGHFLPIGRYHTTDVEEGIARAKSAQAAESSETPAVSQG